MNLQKERGARTSLLPIFIMCLLPMFFLEHFFEPFFSPFLRFFFTLFGAWNLGRKSKGKWNMNLQKGRGARTSLLPIFIMWLLPMPCLPAPHSVPSLGSTASGASLEIEESRFRLWRWFWGLSFIGPPGTKPNNRG